jgi:hypothetical protein
MQCLAKNAGQGANHKWRQGKVIELRRQHSGFAAFLSRWSLEGFLAQLQLSNDIASWALKAAVTLCRAGLGAQQQNNVVVISGDAGAVALRAQGARPPHL